MRHIVRPRVIVEPHREPAVNLLTQRVAKTTNTHNAVDKEDIKEVISNYPDDLIEQLIEQPAGDTLTYRGFYLIEKGASCVSIKDALCFLPYLPDVPEHREAIRFVTSLHHYPQLPTTPDFTADEVTRKQCAALLTVTNEIYSRMRVAGYSFGIIKRGTTPTGERFEIIANEQLVELIMQKPDDARRIADLIIDRATDDAELIKSILYSETPAVVDGIL